ncbi:MAG: O-antigen ligase family protein [Chloroflexi bacterium]|nr:O-antigen ligase family protein [Chloroflexota bacterium]
MISSANFSTKLEQHRQSLLRVLVALAVVVSSLASVYVGPRVPLHDVILLVGVIVGVVALVALLRTPSLGLLALILAAQVVPFTIGTGTDSPINAGMLCLAGLLGLWAIDVFWRDGAQLRPAWPLLPLGLLLATATLSFAVGIQPEMPFAQVAPLRAQIGGLALFWLSAGAFLLVGTRIRDVRWLERMTWLFVALGAVYLAGRLVSPIGHYTTRIFQTGADGSLFFVWLVALSFSQAAFNRQLRPVFRVLLGVIVVAVLVLGFFLNRNWNSGWVPPLVAIFFVLWFAAPRLAAPISVVSVGIALLKFSSIHAYFSDSKGYDILTRTAAWETLINVIKINPIIGLGPANYYWYVLLYPILGYNVNFNSHSNYMDLIAETGIVGLFFFVWFAWEVGRLGFNVRNRVRPGFERAYVYGALGGLAGSLFAGFLGDWFIPFVYNIGFKGFRASVLGWLFLGGLLALHHIYRRATGGLGEAESD